MSEPTLTNLKDFPPGGYQYREVALNWENPEPMQGIDRAASLLQIVRAQNLASGLDPSYSACLEAVKAYTCARLNYNPKYCGVPPAEAQRNASQPTSGRRCASCGRR